MLISLAAIAHSHIDPIQLPKPRVKGEVSLEEAIGARHSVRSFKGVPLTIEQVSQILWAAQGPTHDEERATPSAGEIYPLETFVVVGANGLRGVEPGVYHYDPKRHCLHLLTDGEHRQALANACLEQEFIAEAPLSLVIAAEYERTTQRYGERGIRYVHIEAGHVGQNVSLQSAALGLGTVMIGAFRDGEVARVLSLPYDPLYIMPIGYPRIEAGQKGRDWTKGLKVA